MTRNEKEGHLKSAIKEAVGLLDQMKALSDDDNPLDPDWPDPDVQLAREAQAILEDVLRETA